MKYKVGDEFLTTARIEAINGDRETAPYFLTGVGAGWWSEAALNDLKRMSCTDCKWKDQRHQKCSCCIRNRKMKDNYEW